MLITFCDTLINGVTVTDIDCIISASCTYLQLVWAETKEIGCGYIAHYDGKYYKQQLACNYGPGGNMIGDPVYDTDTSHSCPEGSTENDGLCVW